MKADLIEIKRGLTLDNPLPDKERSWVRDPPPSDLDATQLITHRDKPLNFERMRKTTLLEWNG